MQSSRDIREIQQLRRRVRDLDDELRLARQDLETLGQMHLEAMQGLAESTHQRQREVAAAGRAGNIEAARELGYLSRELRIVRTQLRHLTGLLWSHRDRFLNAETVEGLADALAAIAAEEPEL